MDPAMLPNSQVAEPERAWQNKRRPGQYDHDEDQNVTDVSFIDQFKESLLSKYGALTERQAGEDFSRILPSQLLKPNPSVRYNNPQSTRETSCLTGNSRHILFVHSLR